VAESSRPGGGVVPAARPARHRRAILQTFSSITGTVAPEQVIRLYSAGHHGDRQRAVHGTVEHLPDVDGTAGSAAHPGAERR
jgi:hypothetical protein